jgi:hypothetical protein
MVVHSSRSHTLVTTITDAWLKAPQNNELVVVETVEPNNASLIYLLQVAK